MYRFHGKISPRAPSAWPVLGDELACHAGCLISLALILSPVLILAILIDAFEAVILPRRTTGRFRPTRLMYRLTWPLWSYIPRRVAPSKARATFLSWYGPLSMFMLLALWAGGLILGFGVLQWGLKAPVVTPDNEKGFFVDLYLSGSTFFTLGLGDVTPHSPMSRLLTVIEAGLGFGFLALVIGYLPVLYSAFSKREIQISMLDARAGSPPSAAEILARLASARSLHQMERFLADWEVTGAEILESHLSYPVLMYYRSHHDNQSWLASIAAVLDTCALVLTGVEGIDSWQARNTFAMLRHCLVELGQLLDNRRTDPNRTGCRSQRNRCFSNTLSLQVYVGRAPKMEEHGCGNSGPCTSRT